MIGAGGIVGRLAELATLRARLEDAAGGVTRVVLVRGEAGIGKSRLALELAEMGARDGARAHYGRAWEHGGAPPAWPILEVLRSVGDTSSRAQGALDQARAELRAAASDAEWFSAAVALTTALARLSEEVLTVVVLDDLHWADRPTLYLLRFVAQRLRRARVLVLGTYRDADARLHPHVYGALEEIAREGEALSLLGLREEDVRALVGGDVDLGARVHAATRGNALFVCEVARWLAREPDASGAALLPDGVRAVVAGRLASAPSARVMAEVAAVLAPRFERSLWLDAAARAGVDEVDERAAVAEGQGFVVRDARGELRVSHDVVREAILAEIPLAARARLHRAAADAVLARSGEPAEIARHLAACGDPASAGFAAEAARRAGARGAYAEAAALLEAALEARLSGGRPPDAAAVELLIGLGAARQRAGRLSEGNDTCARAAELARALGAPALFADAALAYGSVLRPGTVDRNHVRLLEEALELVPDDPARRVTLMARIASASQPSPTPEVPLALARQAIDLARRLEEPGLLARVLDMARPAFRVIDDVGERTALDRETLELAARLGDGDLAQRARHRLATDHLDAGDLPRALALCEELAGEPALGPPPATLVLAGFTRMSLHVTAGRFEDAERTLQQIADRYRALHDAEALFPANPLPMIRACLLRARGRVEDEAALDAVDLRGLPWRDVLRASFSTHLGALGQAREALLRVSGRREHLGPGFLPRAVLPEAIAACDDAPLAAELLPLVAELGGANVAAFGSVCEGAAARLMGLLEVTLRRFDEAERHLDQALAMNDRMGAAPFVYATHLARGDMLRLRGRSGDERSAREAYRRAAEGFGALGMTTRVAQVRRRLGASVAGAEGAPVPPRVVRLRGDGVSFRLEGAGDVPALKDGHGLRYIVQLLERPGQGVHVSELAARVRRDAPAGQGDAGPVLDTEAKRAYRARVVDLRDALDEATAFGDHGRAERARAELVFLSSELARAVGLGGRDRRAASDAERLRVNVTLRIRKAIQKIASVSPEVGEHLDRSIRTGAFCCYDPVPGLRVTT